MNDNNKIIRSMVLYLLIFIAIYAMVQLYSQSTEPITDIDYGQLIKYIDANQVKSITLVGNDVKGVLKNGTEFKSRVPDVTNFMSFVNPYILQGKLDFKSEPQVGPPWWVQMLPSLFLIVIFIIFWYIFMQQAQGGGGSKVMSFGKSRARMITDKDKRVTFNDVAGADEEKEELQEIVEFLKYPKKFLELGARIPKGVLLVGPPGTGKTLLAKAVAGEAGVPFFSISGSDFVEMFVGVGAARVRDLFDQAKKNAPCIVFIDEIDAVGRQRGAGLGGGHDEREQTLNQLLVEMDGFSVNEGIIVIAATNRPDILDPALLRPGRFDRHITVGIPDIKGREEILKIHSRNKPLAPDVSLQVLARRTPGFTGADLENLMNEAALLAARRGLKQITMAELEEAITRVIAGPEKRSRIMSEKDKKLVAYHEAGHAVVAKLLPNTPPVHEVTIIPRGRAGGYTMLLPEEDKYYMSKSEMMDEIVHLLGGRVAESLVLNDISTGAQNDIERATNIARKMVTEYGMSERLGPMTFGTKSEEVFLGRDLGRTRNYSEEVAAEIDREIKRIIEEAYKRAESLLKENIDKLHRVAKALIEKEKLNGEEFEKVFNGEDIEGVQFA
ncbi:ATP-dependent zinc metalloprotease FtsH [Thermoanaerobacter brockii subsp. lactiethylicus]|uniref:ATP-dependent zinc metalloprotease FtsH 1 n=3 Tax=Thermoanaerobacter TaxID=1754 RepID=FTSH1_THEPX|nr:MULTISPECIES: ATP-dependent zinc metalloprotease FtsH [Thermoanaerobacter]B0K5A3.1 RecName: Full=ATP-dependent zinc metalloprotease FtsH 1 [Thermoanaerobacter sp. X514]ABY92096.1 ATP-dependent metalloprotease FtsH [Thermoanaerobacter sp. X514]ABY93970.1 ATP-dependent metalloprotease FtsH [Thermoanaerobacter pseudethanolicus ATCC 33223]ADV78926.1 ATP-dependent metalloprotease FtsH [Thermoanaerobacter brockii subsp. finnii Ako-1]HAA80451.1 ATP-dependent zinc metalloprotease FtsH 1 [Thermoanae